MRVAFVEDNEVFQLNYLKWLTALYPKATVDSFVDASEQTTDALLTGGYDLVLLDVQLGERRLGGRSLAKAIHSAEWPRGKKKRVVVVLTATIEPELVPDILSLGVASVRGKPLSADEMREVLSKVFSAQADDLSINLTALRRNVLRGDRFTTLSPIPLRIFDRLVRTPGELVAFSEMQRALGKDTVLTRESIQQHISAIRLGLKELFTQEELAANPMLVAEPGKGYRWTYAPHASL